MKLSDLYYRIREKLMYDREKYFEQKQNSFTLYKGKKQYKFLNN